MPSSVVLQSWKQIAEYLGRTERTVQRWEQEFGLPVRRPSGKSRSSVMALAQEIDEWTRDKPTLAQIRTSARFNRMKFALSGNQTIQGSAEGNQLKRRSELNCALVNMQQQLVQQVCDLRNRQRELLQRLTQNMKAGRS